MSGIDPRVGSSVLARTLLGGLAPAPLPLEMTPGHPFWISGIGVDGFASRVRLSKDGDDWDVEPRSRFPRCDAALPPLSATGSVLIIELARSCDFTPRIDEAVVLAILSVNRAAPSSLTSADLGVSRRAREALSVILLSVAVVVH